MFWLNFGLKLVFGFKPRFETLVSTKDKVTHCVQYCSRWQCSMQGALSDDNDNNDDADNDDDVQ